MASVKDIGEELARVPFIDRVKVVRRVGAELPRLFSATAGGIYLIGRDRHMRRIAGFGPELLSVLCERALRSGLHDVGEPLLLAAERRQGSMASAPILDGTTVLGMVIVYRTADAESLDSTDHGAVIALAKVLGRFLVERPTTAPTVGHRVRAASPRPETDYGDDDDPAREFAEPNSSTTEIPTVLANQIRRIQEDLSMAHKIQQRFVGELPSMLPLVCRGRQVRVVRIASEYRPAFEVGGDFYDLVKTSDHKLVAIIGDVSGKGIAAALIMTRAMTELHALAATGRTPAEILAMMNSKLISDGHDDSFVTAVCVEVDMQSQTLRVANAGHVPPVIRRVSGDLFTLRPSSGAPLGLLQGERYSQQEYRFDLGDIIVLMTDGISEALDLMPEPTADSRLNRTIAEARHDARRIVKSLISEADRHCVTRRDDVALVAMQLG
jgi:hypothetical protein